MIVQFLWTETFQLSLLGYLFLTVVKDWGWKELPFKKALKSMFINQNTVGAA